MEAQDRNVGASGSDDDSRPFVSRRTAGKGRRRCGRCPACETCPGLHLKWPSVRRYTLTIVSFLLSAAVVYYLRLIYINLFATLGNINDAAIHARRSSDYFNVIAAPIASRMAANTTAEMLDAGFAAAHNATARLGQPSVVSWDWPTDVRGGVENAVSIMARVNSVLAIVSNDTIRDIDWAGYVVRGTQAVDWATREHVVDEARAFMNDLDRLVQRMSMFAAALSTVPAQPPQAGGA